MGSGRRTVGKAVKLALEVEPGKALPCSTFVARALIRRHRLEDDPTYAEVGGTPEGSSWYARSSLWAEAADPVWGCIPAWVELGGREVDANARPAGAWTAWQAWALDAPSGPKGHQAVSRVQQWAGSGTGELLLESDEFHGFRDRALTLEERLAELRASYGGTWTARCVLL